MNRTLTLALAAALCAAAGLEAFAAPTRQARPKPAATQAPPETLKLNEAERALVSSSRAAIIAAGFSGAYFDRHFTPHQVVNHVGDRRVVWRFRAGGHEAYVNDSVGFYTDEQGRRLNTHSAASLLNAARDIRRTITRPRAERIMRSCIGEFEGGVVVFQQFGRRPRTALVFTAITVPPVEDAAAAPAGPTPPPAPPAGEGGVDFIRSGGKKRPPLYIGAVDLETGRCVKGKAQAGSPKPDDPAWTPPGPRKN